MWKTYDVNISLHGNNPPHAEQIQGRKLSRTALYKMLKEALEDDPADVVMLHVIKRKDGGDISK